MLEAFFPNGLLHAHSKVASGLQANYFAELIKEQLEDNKASMQEDIERLIFENNIKQHKDLEYKFKLVKKDV
jgi:hypothetical protein